jgi:hypothetical protein
MSTRSEPMEMSALLSKERVASTCLCCGSRGIQRSPAVLMPFVAHRVFHWIPVAIDESWGLQTIPSGWAYSVCNTLYCKECGFVFLDIRFTDEELSRLYDNYRGDDYTALRDYYEPGYLARNQRLNEGNYYIEQVEDFLEPYMCLPLKLLDWGGDTGKNTPFKTKSIVLDIFDISEKKPIRGARKVTKAHVLAEKYDLIVCSNVLEHIPYPAEILSEIKACMYPDTVLYLEVPLEEIMRDPFDGFHRNKRHWHEHINFFSENALRRLLSNCGLDIIGYKVLRVTSEGRICTLFQLACRLRRGCTSLPIDVLAP